MYSEKEISKTFGARLTALMKEKGIPKKGGARALAKALLDAEIIGDTANLWYTKGLGDEEYQEAVNKYIDGVKTSVQKHLKAESASQISGEWLTRYCKFFECSADYLFGMIDKPTHEKTDISEFTGLSEHSIDVLNRMNTQSFIANPMHPDDQVNKNCLQMINVLLEQGYGHINDDGLPIGNKTIFSEMYEYVYGAKMGTKVVHLSEDKKQEEIQALFFTNPNGSNVLMSAETLKELYANTKRDMILKYFEWLRNGEESNGNHH